MTSVNVVDCLCFAYSALWSMKAAQLVLYLFKKSKSSNKKSEEEKLEYNSSMASFFLVLDALSGERPASTIPRREFREITDPMFERYLKEYSRRDPKTFRSLMDAKRNCFREFTGDTGYWIDFGNRISDFLRQPLGLVWMFTSMQFVSMFVAFLLREILIVGGTAKSCICKVAGSVTMTEIYVVCRKENITFEEAIWKYPWSHGTFSKIAAHPLIGTNVCPLYKKRFQWPEDTMDFEIEVKAVPTGNAILRQKYDNALVDAIKKLRLSHVGVMAVGAWLWVRHGTHGCLSVAPVAARFYVSRVTVDYVVGTRWLTHDL